MKAEFVHVNIIASDWRKLAEFYMRVFGCEPVPPERNLSGEWLEKGTGIRGAEIQGIHLRLPGNGNKGPTLEIFQYSKNKQRIDTSVNREGIGHIAFQVDNIEEFKNFILKEGGILIGETVTLHVKGAGTISFLYLTDPEENIIELQRWE